MYTGQGVRVEWCAMMSEGDWRKRAQDCMAASERAPSLDGLLRWLALSYAWLECADWRDRAKFESNETRGAVSATVVHDRTNIIDYGERLRARLSLVDLSD